MIPCEYVWPARTVPRLGPLETKHSPDIRLPWQFSISTRSELRRGILELPQETADSASQMRRVIVDQIEALAELNRIVARHECLRTHFVVIDGTAMQVVARSLRIPLPVEDLAGLDGPDRESAVVAAMGRDRAEPFDLGRGPLLRMRLLRLGPAEHLLLRNCHHIVSDGWSQGVFDRELEALYAARAAGGADRLPAPAIQYREYAAWQRQWLTGGELERQTEYWRRRLADAPTLELPLDRPRPSRPTYRGGLHRLALPAALGRRLREFNRNEGVTPFMVMLGVFSFAQLNVDLFPKSDAVSVYVRVQLPGASPEEAVSQVVLERDISEAVEDVREIMEIAGKEISRAAGR